MTSKRDEFSVSRLELVVLARHSASKPPGADELGEAVRRLMASNGVNIIKAIEDSLSSLRQRGLLTPPKRTVSRLSEAGSQMLRHIFSLPRTPTWTEIRDKHLPSLGLDLKPGSDAASRVLGNGKDLFTEVLHAQFNLPRAGSITKVCDALLLDSLGLSPPPATAKLTLAWLRTKLMAKRVNLSDSEAMGLAPAGLAKKAISKHLKVSATDKKSLVAALSRRWLTGQVGHVLISEPVISAVTNGHHRDGKPPEQPNSTTTSLPPRPKVSNPSQDTLLKVVREALPRIGADGRFGAEKVFVSAIWRGIEGDSRVSTLSYDEFKKWLVTANREGNLVLVRADLGGAMNAKLVSDSLIQDGGATFHFVLDRRTVSDSERRSHAR